MTDQPFRTTTPTTRPQMPQEPRNRSPWPWLCLSMILLAAVYLLRDTSAPAVTAEPIPAPQSAQTVVVEVVLSLPTATVTPIPTLYPTAKATADVSLVWCSNVTPKAGTECQQDPDPTPTDAPRPECPTTAGRWCVFPPTDETNGEVIVD